LYTYRAINYETLEEAILLELKQIKPIILESMYTKFVTEGLADCVENIQICEIENLQDDYVNVEQVWNKV